MGKENLKQRILEHRGNICAFSGETLPSEQSEFKLFDTHRQIPKEWAGLYTLNNTLLADPVAHQRHHGNIKERSEELKELKALVEDRSHVQRLRMKIQQQIDAYLRGVDHRRDGVIDVLREQFEKMKKKETQVDRQVKKAVAQMNSPFVEAAEGVKGFSYITQAYCLVYLDPYKAKHASSYWKYTGLHVPNYQRYQKGVKGGGNKKLRTQLYAFSVSQVQLKGPYSHIYNRKKAELEQRTDCVWSRGTDGTWYWCRWCDTKKIHRADAAHRVAVKHLLADVWCVQRYLLGLPVGPAYPEFKWGHSTVMPQERGWIL